MSITDNFARLPSELVLRICELVDCGGPWPWHGHPRSICKISALSALARTSKRNHGIANPILYEAELQEYFGYGLIWAAKFGRTESLDKFLQYGGRTYINDTGFSMEYQRHSMTPVEHLVHKLFPEFLEDDWWKFQNDYDDEMAHIFTPLAVAAMSGQVEMVARLLDHGARIDTPSLNLCSCLVHTFDVYHDRLSHPRENPFWTPLHLAACRGHTETVKLLISRGANAKQVAKLGSGGSSVLHAAAFTNCLPVMEYILENKVYDVDGDQNENPLHFAVLHMGDISGVKMLVAAGASLTAASLNTPAGTACLAGNFEAALWLMDKMEETSTAFALWMDVNGPPHNPDGLLNKVRRPWSSVFPTSEPPGLSKSMWLSQQATLIQRLEHLRANRPDIPSEDY